MSLCLLNRNTINVKRKGQAQNVRGQMVEAPSSTFTVKGSLQPERNLKTIREVFGSHIEGAIKIYSKDRLRTKEKDGDADVVVYQDRDWEVAEVRRYDDLIPHYKIIALLKKDER